MGKPVWEMIDTWWVFLGFPHASVCLRKVIYMRTYIYINHLHHINIHVYSFIYIIVSRSIYIYILYIYCLTFSIQVGWNLLFHVVITGWAPGPQIPRHWRVLPNMPVRFWLVVDLPL